jgi:hypothetical protein
MMRVRPLCRLIGYLAAIATGQGVDAFGQQTTPASPYQAGAAILAAPPAEDVPPRGALVVAPHPTCPEPYREFEQDLARRLTAANLPEADARLAFFASIDHGESQDRTGWHGIIWDAAPLLDGYLVTIRLNARYTLMFDNQYVLESYFVSPGGVHLLGVRVPEPAPKRLMFGL